MGLFIMPLIVSTDAWLAHARPHDRICLYEMKVNSQISTQALVFSLVAAAFTTVYITQPVLPVIRDEFDVDATIASLTVSMVILGVALANLPFGMLADRFPIKPIILAGGTIVAVTSMVCATTYSITFFIGARFIQGLFIPSLTTCLAAYLAKSLPPARLNVVMGSYVSATVAGGLGGRLLGGWIHPPLHWRYAFVSSAVLLLAATFASYRWLPRETKESKPELHQAGFIDLLAEPSLLRALAVAFSAYGWHGVVALGIAALLLPLGSALLRSCGNGTDARHSRLDQLALQWRRCNKAKQCERRIEEEKNHGFGYRRNRRAYSSFG